ncbi:MAG: histidinol-phosphatase HisJ [Proteobacteria bacterium]|nr:histidinol-phosphatase HisJ [Desulfobacula sp.]MBU3952600.1 histidinol-phosphatase HisJ [Pseudomonadota bacterium]MBU4133305.1 histidinol-phosphatase HisJ [Pseudomonadota bacterium]
MKSTLTTEEKMMTPIDIFSDHHMHSTYSDGTDTIETMVKSAIKKGLHTIAITDHMPLPFKTRYAMDKQRLVAYRNEIDRVRQQYGHKLTILTGLEIEYIPQIATWIEDIVAMDWDVLIASVHSILVEGDHYMVNGNEQEFKKTLDHAFKGDIKALYQQYYQTIQQAAATQWFDIAGHLDVIKKHNGANPSFDETDSWHQTLIEQTLDLLKTHHLKMEINTSGLNHPAKAAYPSPWIIRSAVKRGIPIVMGSDSHSPETLGRYFDRINGLMENPE